MAGSAQHGLSRGWHARKGLQFYPTPAEWTGKCLLSAVALGEWPAVRRASPPGSGGPVRLMPAIFPYRRQVRQTGADCSSPRGSREGSLVRLAEGTARPSQPCNASLRPGFDAQGYVPTGTAVYPRASVSPSVSWMW